MRYYHISVLDKKTNKKYLEFAKYPSTVSYWQKVIKKDNVGSNLVLADFTFNNYFNQIIMTRYILSTLERDVDIQLITDYQVFKKLDKR